HSIQLGLERLVRFSNADRNVIGEGNARNIAGETGTMSSGVFSHLAKYPAKGPQTIAMSISPRATASTIFRAGFFSPYFPNRLNPVIFAFTPRLASAAAGGAKSS